MESNDCQGPAVEIIGLVSMALTTVVLRIGLSLTSSSALVAHDNDNDNDNDNEMKEDNNTSSETKTIDTITADGIIRELRASFHVKALQTPTHGWAQFVCFKDILSSSSSTLPACVNVVQSIAGAMAFSKDLPFKSISLCLEDYCHCHYLMSTLYVGSQNFGDMTYGRKGLKQRADMETLSKWKENFKSSTKSKKDVVKALEDFASVMARSPKNHDAVVQSVNNLRVQVGEEGYGDALAVVAFSSFMTRVVDASGHSI